MYKIGNYNGIPCYKTTRKEFLKNRGQEAGSSVIYVIEDDNGRMIRDNRIIGVYDGRVVHEMDGEEEYISVPKVVKEEKVEVEAKEEKEEKKEEVEVEIDLDVLTTQADEFLKRLEEETDRLIKGEA